MTIQTLEDAGWRKLCPKGSPVGTDIVRSCVNAGYKIVESEIAFLIEPCGFKGLYSLFASYTRDNFQPQTVEFDLGKLPAVPQRTLQSSIVDPQKFIEEFLHGPHGSLDALRALKSLVTLMDVGVFPAMMAQRVLPAFLEKYPGGRVHVIAISKQLSYLPACVRVLSPTEIFESHEIKPLGPVVGRMMSEAHSTLSEDFGVNALETVLFFMVPYSYGFICPRLNCEVIFQFPEPVESFGRYPREIIDLAVQSRTNKSVGVGDHEKQDRL